MKDIEIDILNSAKRRDGKIIAEITKPLLGKYTESRMRYFAHKLCQAGYLKLKRNEAIRCVFVNITKKGQRAIQ